MRINQCRAVAGCVASLVDIISLFVVRRFTFYDSLVYFTRILTPLIIYQLLTYLTLISFFTYQCGDHVDVVTVVLMREGE
eukprot:g572.t1